jgi:MFS family permease
MTVAGPVLQPSGQSVDTKAAIAAIAAISVVGIAIGLGIPLLSIVMENRGYSASLIGTNTAIAGLASLVAAPFAAPIAARFGVVQTIGAMIVLGAVSFLGFYLFDSFLAWGLLRATLHFALTLLFVLSEFWITVSAPPEKRGLMLGVYATVLSLGFALGPLLFAQIGSAGIAPFATGFGIILLALIPVLLAWNRNPDIAGEEKSRFLPFVIAVPTATAAVLVFGAVETGGFSLLPVYGTQLGYSESDSALLLTVIGLGNVLMQIPIGLLSDKVRDRRHLLLALAVLGIVGVLSMTLFPASWLLLALVLFIWGGAVAGLYTVGLAHLGASFTGRDLASANAAFVFCYAVGMLLGPQTIGIGMDWLGPNGFSYSLAVFFILYICLVLQRIAFVPRQP